MAHLLGCQLADCFEWVFFWLSALFFTEVFLWIFCDICFEMLGLCGVYCSSCLFLDFFITCVEMCFLYTCIGNLFLQIG